MSLEDAPTEGGFEPAIAPSGEEAGAVVFALMASPPSDRHPSAGHDGWLGSAQILPGEQVQYEAKPIGLGRSCDKEAYRAKVEPQQRP
jgi:hypothetical protein